VNVRSKKAMMSILFWAIVLVEIAIFSLIIVRALKSDELSSPSISRIEDELQMKVLASGILEFLAWILVMFGVVIDVYGFLQSAIEIALSLIVVGGSMITGGVILSLHFRGERIRYSRELKMTKESRKRI
jgi:hypothetical protein